MKTFIRYEKRYDSFVCYAFEGTRKVASFSYTVKRHGPFAKALAKLSERTMKPYKQWFITDGETVAIYRYDKHMNCHRVLIDYKFISLLQLYFISVKKKPESLTPYAHVVDKGRQIKLHRLIMEEHDPSVAIDHINHDGLDNRLCNLRRATAYINNRNKPVRNVNKLGIEGVERRGTSYRASYRDPSGAMVRKTFSVTEYGSDDKALDAAKQWRQYFVDKYYFRQSAAKPQLT